MKTVDNILTYYKITGNIIINNQIYLQVLTENKNEFIEVAI